MAPGSKPLRIKVCPQPGQCPGLYIPTNVPPEHPQFGQSLPCACERRRQAERLKRALAPEWRRMTFATYHVTEQNRQAVEAARRFAADPWQGVPLLTLIGNNQSGKTHLALAIINALLEAGEPAYVNSVPELLDDLRAGFEDARFWRTFDQAKSAPLLLLDDLGAQSDGGSGEVYAVTWTQDKLYSIINTRLVHGLPTIVTTNLPRRLLPPRLAARLWNQRYGIVKAVAAVDERGAG
jgi:DNA replication protein DnaC